LISGSLWEAWVFMITALPTVMTIVGVFVRFVRRFIET
jgi:hypothetical protein